MTLERLTPQTITDKRKLKTEIRKVGESGYAVDNEEWTQGLKCVAAPILDFYGKVQGTLSVSGPSDRLSAERVVSEIIPAVVDHASEISRKMGFLIGKGQE